MSQEITQAIDKLCKTFEEFKAANDSRLKIIEGKGYAPADIEEKVNKIALALGDAESAKKSAERLDEIEKKMNRLALGGAPEGKGETAETKAHREGFSRFMRKGEDAGLRDLEVKALNITQNSGADGGYAVPTIIDKEILAQLVNVSDMRRLAKVVTVGTSDWKKLVSTNGTASGWVDEDDARTATNTPQLASIAGVMGELYANPQATQQMLDDVFFDAEAWLAGEVAIEFARAEGAAFIVGTGTKQPKGITAYTTAATADGARAFGTIEHVATGVSGNWPATNPADILTTLVYKIKKGHRSNGVFLMNALTLAAVMKFKDGNGDYLWRPGLAAGQPSTLTGYPVEEMSDMPDVGSNALAVAFGNFKAAYVIIDRMGTRVLRDPYTNKPYVGFYTTKRVGGNLVDSEAVKFIKFAAA